MAHSNRDPPSRSGPWAGHGKTIRVAESNAQVRLLNQIILRRQGYTVLLAETGSQAIAIYAQTPGPIDGVLLDADLGAPSGLDTLEELRRLDPRVRVVLASSYLPGEVSPGYGALACTLLPKPYRAEQLLAAVRTALAAPVPGCRGDETS